MNKQRETLIITHDIQLKKLHDSYSTKLHEAEQWPDRLQKELNHEREQHRIARNELERHLRESFQNVCLTIYCLHLMSTLSTKNKHSISKKQISPCRFF